MDLKKILFLAMLCLLALPSLAFKIQSPEATVYSSTEISLNIISNQSLYNISYSIDNSQNILACQNCTNFSTSLNLSLGNHTIDAFGVSENETFIDTVSFSIQENQTFNLTNGTINFTIEVIEPKNIAYNATEIGVKVLADKLLNNLSIKIDNQSYQQLCQNCSSYNTSINVTEGNHTFYAKGSLSGTEKEASVSFSARNSPPQPQEGLNLIIVSPQPRNYTSKTILFNFTTNLNSTINYVLDNQVYTACASCSSFLKFVTLQSGKHILFVNATAGNLSDAETVNFSIISNKTKIPKNETKNKTATRRFGKGFEKLPKLVEKGEISDEELAEIIRSNKLNPGIINRLIKTGRLGTESIEAITETQFKPKGILKKLLKLLGIKQKTHADLIYENYNLTLRLEYKMLSSDDISDEYVKKIEKKLEKKIEIEIEHENESEKEFGSEEIKPNKSDKDKKKVAEKIIKKELKEKLREKEKKVYKAAKQNGKHADEDDKEESEINKKSDNGNKGRRSENKNSGKGKGKSKYY